MAIYKISLIVVGKLKEAYWREAQIEYLKRLKNYAKIEVIELKPEALGPTVTPIQSMTAEGERIIKALPSDAFVVAMDVPAKTMSSEILAERCQEWGGNGTHLMFVIGGAAGLSATVRERAQARLSLSSMTFTHELARVVLLEQIYRAMTILAGKTYHY